MNDMIRETVRVCDEICVRYGLVWKSAQTPEVVSAELFLQGLGLGER